MIKLWFLYMAQDGGGIRMTCLSLTPILVEHSSASEYLKKGYGWGKEACNWCDKKEKNKKKTNHPKTQSF